METFEDVFPTELWFSELAGQIRLVKYYSIWPEFTEGHTIYLNTHANSTKMLSQKNLAFSIISRHSSTYGTLTYTWLNISGKSI